MSEELAVLTEQMAERIYVEAFAPEDAKGWLLESEGMREIFRGYARAAQAAVVDCQDLTAVVALLSPEARLQLAMRARGQ